MSTSQTPLVYIESRQNIGSISISISHPHPTRSEITISQNDTQSIHISTPNSPPIDVKLPASVPVGQITLPSPASGLNVEKDMTLKLPIAKEIKLSQTRDEITTPWSASELRKHQDVRIHCSACNAVLVEKRKIKVWKDLPSNNWAEMMDFWHCHKPDDHGHDHGKEGCEGGVQKKKFGGGFEEKVGTGLVGLGEVMVHGEDTEGVVLREGAKTTTLACKACKADLGDVDERNLGLRRLRKWSIAISVDDASQPTAHPPIYFISAQLLTLADEQAVRHFYFANPKSSPELPGIRLWLFHPDMGISVHPTPAYLGDQVAQPSGTVFWRNQEITMPMRSMKVMYKIEEEGGSSFKEDRVDLPTGIWKRLLEELKGSSQTLPENDRSWAGWMVGWIRRF